MRNTAPKCCPNCGHSLPVRPVKSRPEIQRLSQVEIDRLSSTDLYDYFKRIAPHDDLAFALRPDAQMSADLRAQFEGLNPFESRADFYRKYHALRALWRSEANARDRAELLATGWTQNSKGFWIDPGPEIAAEACA